MAVNVQAAVEAQLLGVNLVGMVSKVTAKEGEKNRQTVEFLIMPSQLDENEPITVQKVVDEINRTIYKIKKNTSEIPLEGVPAVVSVDAVNNAMDLVGLKDAELTFMQTFIHYKKVTKDDQPDPVTNITEYAIGIHIKGKNNPISEDFKFLQIKEAYINVWDTKKQKVLERMQIWTPEQMEMK